MSKHRKLSLTERMQRIRKRDTKPELMVRRILHTMGYRYRLHVSNLPGCPDIILPRRRKAILVHGCFWHRHNCPDGRKVPTSKPDYWGAKLMRNRQRDEENISALREQGWDVLVIWECELRTPDLIACRLESFLAG